MLTDNLNMPLILVVEDDENHAELIQESFQSDEKYFYLKIVSSLNDARTAIEQKAPALVLSDYRLPDGYGKELLDISNGSWPVILMTSHGDEQVAADCMKAGVLDYIIKSPEMFIQLPFRLAGLAVQAQQALKEQDNT